MQRHWRKEFLIILAGNSLTVNQLLASPKLRKGLDSLYEEVDQPGLNRHREKAMDRSRLPPPDFWRMGTPFQFEWRDMGKKDGNGQDFVRHVHIAFK
jgi:hypothetical protein